MKRVFGGMLVQDWDCEVDQRENMRVVSHRAPTEQEWGDLLFGWRVAKHTKSNAIILSKDLMTIGVGAGQMSRVDSANLAVSRAQFPLDGSAVASDAYLPLPRRARGLRQCRRDLRDTPRRVQAGRRSSGAGKRAGDGDGDDGAAPLQTLALSGQGVVWVPLQLRTKACATLPRNPYDPLASLP